MRLKVIKLNYYCDIDQNFIKPKKLIRIDEGKNVELICKSNDETLWFFNDKPITHAKGKKIVIKRIKLSEQGYYICKGLDGSGKKTFLARVLVLVNRKSQNNNNSFLLMMIFDVIVIVLTVK